MAFIAETEILTRRGWILVEELAGKDKILVKNFLGEAEFIQPFALKKKKYEDSVITIGTAFYEFTVTPDHIIGYTSGNYKEETAKDFSPNKKKFLDRRFRYMSPPGISRQKVKFSDETDGYMDGSDWYRLLGYVVRKGYISSGNNPRLIFYPDSNNLMGVKEILSTLGINWYETTRDNGEKAVVARNTSNLANKLKLYLGSRQRKKMRLPDSLVYNTTKEHANILIQTVIESSKVSKKTDNGKYQWSSSNKDLIDSIELLGTFSGYSIRSKLVKPAGYRLPSGLTTKRPQYNVYIQESISSVCPRNKSFKHYSGSVYSIDILDGQVFVRNKGCLPLWINPK